MAKVTWLLAVKDAAPYLEACLESIASQDFQDHGILAWDNGSSDETVGILQKWIPERIPGRVICDQPCAFGESLRKMVELADSPYCARIDGDDICLPQRLSQQVAFLDSHLECAVVGGQVQRINEEGKPLPKPFIAPCAFTDILHRMLVSNPLCHPTVLFRSEAILDVGNYQIDCHFEDYELWLRVAGKYDLANLSECVLKYRTHKESLSNQRDQAVLVAEQATLSIQGAQLWGLAPHEFQALFQKQFLTSLRLAPRIAASLQKRDGMCFRKRLRMRSFLDMLYAKTHPHDYFSHAVLACLKAFAK